MTTNFAKWLAVALCAALMLSGCGMVSIDKATEDAQAVAEFTGGKITRAEAMEEYENWASMYEAYGYPLTDETDIAQVKEEVLNYMVQERIIKAKAEEMGLTELTEEDKAEIASQSTAEYEDMVGYYMMYFEGDTDEETRQNAVDYLNSSGYTLESIEQYNIDSAWQEKLKDQITSGVSVSDEQVHAAYEEAVAQDQEAFTEDSYNFESAVTYGDSVVWVPEGYRTVKHILIKLSDEDVAVINDLYLQAEDIGVRIEEMKNPEAAAEEGDAAFADVETVDALTAADDAAQESDADADDAAQESDADADDAAQESAADADDADAQAALAAADEPAAEEKALDDMTLEELEAQKIELEKQLEALREAGIAKIQPKIDEIQVKIQAGEDFEKLIEEYGEDEGMQTEPTMTTGYYVSENSQMWDDAFTRASMALGQVGDVSEPVLGQSGVHIIKYMSDVTAGAVPIEQVHQAIEEQALEQAQNDLYDGTIAQWVDEAGVKLYLDRMN
jgi:hypothetical protein